MRWTERTIPEWLAALLGLGGAILILGIIFLAYWFTEVRG